MARRLLERSGTDPLPVAAAVHAWYRRHGVVPRWRPGARDELEPIGRNDTDAERSLIWLHEQVAPLVRRLQEWYSRRDLIALLFDGAAPQAMQADQLEEDVENAAYDAWTIESRSAG